MKRHADKLNLRTKNKTKSDGVQTSRGNRPFERSHIYYILTNPIYAGRVRHGKVIHEGLHPHIIDPTIWDQVQNDLTSLAPKRGGHLKRSTQRPLLKGKLFDETGDRLTPSYTMKKGIRYRYYVSNRLLAKQDRSLRDQKGGWRLAAKPLETQLTNAIRNHLKAVLIKDLTGTSERDSIASLHTSLNAISVDPDISDILACVSKAEITPGKMQVVLCGEALANLVGVGFIHICPNAVKFDLPFKYRKRGAETKFIMDDAPAERDHVLIQNLAKANCYLEAIKGGRTFDEVAKANNTTARRFMQVIDFAFLAPDIVKSIMQGKQAVGLTSEYLQRHSLPANWHDQRQIIITL